MVHTPDLAVNPQTGPRHSLRQGVAEEAHVRPGATESHKSHLSHKGASAEQSSPFLLHPAREARGGQH